MIIKKYDTKRCCLRIKFIKILHCFVGAGNNNKQDLPKQPSETDEQKCISKKEGVE
jgi:hypothetical protein